MAETIWILPEYCPGAIFLGWHLYERHPTVAREGVSVTHWLWKGLGGYSQLKDWDWLQPVQALIREVRSDAPEVGYDRRAENKFIEWFVQAFPVGFLLDVDAVGYHGHTRLRDVNARNLREPTPDLGAGLAYLNSHCFLRAAKRHGDAFVDGAPGHPREKWTSHDWMCVLQNVEEATWHRDLARAIRHGTQRPAPLGPRYAWMERAAPAPAEPAPPPPPPAKRPRRRRTSTRSST